MLPSKLTPAYIRPDSKSAAQGATRSERGQEHNNLWLATLNSSRNTQLRTHYGKYILRQTEPS
jgi:hypothetical protein